MRAKQARYGIRKRESRTRRYDTIVVAVAHRGFVALGPKGVRAFGSPNAVIFDIKHVLPKTLRRSSLTGATGALR
jgi:UDP-N-acetyl-D-galactosamine dehydrogenase